MIDYEKLTTAHALIKKLSPSYFSIIFCHDEIHVNFYYSPGDIDCVINNLDGLIAKLTELTQTQPKYKENQQIWYLNGHEVDTSLIEKVVKNDNSINYVINDGYTSLPECALFPTKLDLIKFQANYWDKLWEENRVTFDLPTRFAMGSGSLSSCQHESDGNCYTSDPSKYKCKLCGEFYK